MELWLFFLLVFYDANFVVQAAVNAAVNVGCNCFPTFFVNPILRDCTEKMGLILPIFMLFDIATRGRQLLTKKRIILFSVFSDPTFFGQSRRPLFSHLVDGIWEDFCFFAVFLDVP